MGQIASMLRSMTTNESSSSDEKKHFDDDEQVFMLKYSNKSNTMTYGTLLPMEHITDEMQLLINEIAKYGPTVLLTCFRLNGDRKPIWSVRGLDSNNKERRDGGEGGDSTTIFETFVSLKRLMISHPKSITLTKPEWFDRYRKIDGVEVRDKTVKIPSATPQSDYVTVTNDQHVTMKEKLEISVSFAFTIVSDFRAGKVINMNNEVRDMLVWD